MYCIRYYACCLSPVQKNAKKIKAPGQSKLHYSPGIPVKLNRKNAKKNQALIGFGKKFDQMSFVQGKNDELYSNDFSIKRYTRVILEFEKISEFIPPENLEKYIIRPAPKVNAIELKKDALRLGGSFLHAYTESIVKESHWWRVAKKKPNKTTTYFQVNDMELDGDFFKIEDQETFILFILTHMLANLLTNLLIILPPLKHETTIKKLVIQKSLFYWGGQGHF